MPWTRGEDGEIAANIDNDAEKNAARRAMMRNMEKKELVYGASPMPADNARSLSSDRIRESTPHRALAQCLLANNHEPTPCHHGRQGRQ